MKPNTLRLAQDCVEIGVRRGFNRAKKYNDNPTDEEIIASIENAVMAQFHDYFTFDYAFNHE